MPSVSVSFFGEDAASTHSIATLLNKQSAFVVPKKFVKYLDIITNENTTRLNGEHLLVESIDRKNIGKLIESLIVTTTIHAIEITLDFSAISKQIKQDSDKLFSSVFVD